MSNFDELRSAMIDIAEKRVTRTDVSKASYVPTAEQRRIMNLAGFDPVDHAVERLIEIRVAGTDEVLPTTYYSSRRQGSGREPEIRMGRGLVNWLEEGDTLWIGTDGTSVFALKSPVPPIADADEEQNGAAIHRSSASVNPLRRHERPSLSETHSGQVVHARSNTQEEHLPPNYSKLDTALRSIGYSFESAVADIIDNSLDAGATDIRVRLVTSKSPSLDLVIWDNGSGMDEPTLREALRFGADVSSEMKRLGKFGLGLKLASLSQAKALTVYTWRGGTVAGRGWLEDGISKGFSSTILSQSECKHAVRTLSKDFPHLPTGTLVHWSHLYRIRIPRGDIAEHAQKLLRRLQNHIGIAFHRFLGRTTRKVRIRLDVLNADQGSAGLPKAVAPLNPFGYERSGNPDFPDEMKIDANLPIAVRAHIWPANSDLKEYKLPGGANSRQGFYFYRNDRLIQAGGWNGIREAEPHSSLARVEIDVGPQLDLEFSLDVKKAEIQLPPHLIAAIEKARTASGVDFKKYLGLAKSAYSSRARRNAELPLIPGDGLPAVLREAMRQELRIPGVSRIRKLRFEWAELCNEEFFQLDRENDVLLLNRAFRRQLLHGLPGSSADIPVVKCLLFMLLRDAFYSERLGSKLRERLDQANRILLAAVRYERCER